MPDELSVLASIAQIVAAVVATVSIVFIALQTKATRLAAEAGRRAADTAAAALEQARDDQRMSRFLAQEAVRARLDNQTPRVTVTAEPDIVWPPIVPSGFAGGEAQPLRLDAVFQLPKDGSLRVIARIRFSIQNAGPGEVRFQCTPGVREAGRPVSLIVIPEGREKTNFDVEVVHSVAEWIDIYKQRDEFQDARTDTRIQLWFTGAPDATVTEYHTIVLDGTIVEPVPEAEGSWRLLKHPEQRNEAIGAIAVALEPSTRRYHLSRKREVELDPMPDAL